MVDWKGYVGRINREMEVHGPLVGGKHHTASSLVVRRETSCTPQKPTYKQNQTRIQVRDSRLVLLILWFLTEGFRSLNELRRPETDV